MEGKLIRDHADIDPPSLVELLQATARSAHKAPDFDSRSTTAYLDHLVSTPLASLVREPSTVSAESYNVESELVNLCFREYTTFISVHRCAQAVQSAFDDFETSLGRLMDSVPSLEEECRTFSKSTAEISASRVKASLVQEHEDKLLDLLEMPRLMETCVRNGYYQEAMELASHAAELGKKYEDVALVQVVLVEVRGVEQVMVAQLLALLREPVKLAALVKAVSYLRRLGVGDESSLSLVFLTSRLHNFRAALVEVERDRGEPVRYIRKYIDLFREHVYDIIAQHTSIFNETAHIASFAGQCVTDLVQLVASHVPRIGDSASLSSILVQLGYCALSFARIGLDFSTLIGEAFEGVVLSTYSTSVGSATSALVTTLTDAEKNAASPTDILVSPDHRTDVLAADFSAFSLATAYLAPLALFVNAHLTALNTLRLLAPSTLFPQIAAEQSASLCEASAAVGQYLRASVIDERPGHRRTPSSPRAHLLRRSTDTLLSPEIRLARRREALRLCAVFAQAWDVAMVYLVEGLVGGVYGRECEMGTELKERLDDLRRWAEQHKEKVPNGNQDSIAEEAEGKGNSDVGDPRTPTRTPLELADVEEDVEGMRSGTLRETVPNTRASASGSPTLSIQNSQSAPPVERLLLSAPEFEADPPALRPLDSAIDSLFSAAEESPPPPPDLESVVRGVEDLVDGGGASAGGTTGIGQLMDSAPIQSANVRGEGLVDEVAAEKPLVSEGVAVDAVRDELDTRLATVLAQPKGDVAMLGEDPSSAEDPVVQEDVQDDDRPDDTHPPDHATPDLSASRLESPVEATTTGGKKKKKRKGKR